MSGKNSDSENFGEQMALILPILMREASKSHRILCREGNLSIPSILILDLLRECSECKMSVIAKVLGISMSTATGLVDKMITDNLVKRERSSKDRRVVTISMKKKGKDFAGKLKKLRVDSLNRMYSVLTKKERDEYLSLIRKVYKSLEVKK